MSEGDLQQLRPLALGELIDRSVRFWRRNWKALFLVYLPFQLARYGLLKLYQGAVQRYFPYAAGGRAAAEAIKVDPSGVLKQFGASTAALLPTLTIFWLVASFAALVVVHYVATNVMGTRTTGAKSFRGARARVLTLLRSCVLTAAWGLAVGLAAMLPGVAIGALAFFNPDRTAWAVSVVVLGAVTAGAGMIIAALWWFLRFLLVTPVVAVENEVSALQSLRRATALISGRVGPGLMGRVMVRATLLVTASIAILWTAQFLTSLPQLVLTFVYANPLDPANSDLGAIPLAMLIPAELLQVVAQSLLTPLYLSMIAFFYVDLRVRREGLDLELRLAAL
ncbi:MAG: hypothetical protein ACT4TC_09450 [Myxococcaceae bacterium]